MIIEEKDNKPPVPPYIPYKTFKRLIGTLKETIVPQRIDPSVLNKFSGSDIAALIPALKFFNLIDREQMTTPLLDELVGSYETTEWKGKIKGIVTKSYEGIIGGLNLSSATRKQLEEKFREISTSPAVLNKCIRFYVTICQEAGVHLSKFITMRQKVRNGYVKVPKSKIIEKMKPKDQQKEKPLIDQSGYEEFTGKILGKDPIKILVPKDIAEEDWMQVSKAIELTTEMIKNYFGFSTRRQEK